MRMILLGATALALAGCAAGDGLSYTGPERAIQGQIDTTFFDFNGMNTTFNSETELPLPGIVTPEGGHTDIPSTLKTRPDGTIEVTGPSVWLYGVAAVCRSAPDAPMCHRPETVLPN